MKYNYSDMKTGRSGKPKIEDYQHTTARVKETVNKGEFRSGCGKSTSDDYFYRATGQRLHKEDPPETHTLHTAVLSTTR